MPASVEVILPGFPARTNRGVLGFCTVSLISSDVKILFDTGHYSDRQNLLAELKRRHVEAQSIDQIVLSHLHFDHCLNIDLFQEATLVLSKRELDYASSKMPEERGDFSIPKPIIGLVHNRKMIEANEGVKLAEGVKVVETPGHTPGSISLLVEGEGRRTILVGDAVKNAWEFNRGEPEITFGESKDARESIKKIKAMGDVIVPGHDRRFVFKDGRVDYLDELDLRIYARIAPELERWTVYSISTRSTLENP